MENQNQSLKNCQPNIQHINVIKSIEKKALIKEDMQHMLIQFSKSPQNNSNKAFYQKIKIQYLQEMVAMVFDYKNKYDHKHNRNITNFIQMLKTGGGFAQFIAEHPQFNKQIIFGFLEHDPIDNNILCVFGDIFVNLARNNPAKVIQIIKDQDVQNILIRNLKKSQVMSIIYTAIFCLNQQQSQQYNKFIGLVIHGLLRAPFEDSQGQNIFSHRVCSEIRSSLTNQDQVYQQSRKERKKSMDKIQKCEKNFMLCEEACINKGHCFFDQHNHTYFNEVVDSIQNLGDMINQISTNLDAIYLGNVQILLDLILKHTYVKQLFELLIINQRMARNRKEDLSSEILRLVYEILYLFKRYTDKIYISKSKKCLKKIKSGALDEKKQRRERRQSIQMILEAPLTVSQKRQGQRKIKYTQQDQGKLLRVCQQVAQYLALYTKQNCQSKLRKSCFQHSSGLKIEKIGLCRYWILKIHLPLLHVISATESEAHQKYGLKSALPGLLPLIQQCMAINRWNNIAQALIVEIIRLYIKVCYAHFYHRAVNIQKVSHGFLGFLIEHFRNKYHIFLNTMKFATQGDRNAVFEISRLISAQLHSNRDLLWLFGKFPQWKEFMQKDLQQYEKASINKSYFDDSMLQPQQKSSQQQITQKQIQIPSQLQRSSVQQLVQIYKEYWSIDTNEARKSKLKIKNTTQIVQAFTTCQSQQSSQSIDD